MQTQDPSEELSAGLRASREFQDDGWLLGGHLAGPLADALGGRLAFQYKSNANFWKVTPQRPVDPVVQITNPERGESSVDGRATFQWDVADALGLNLKVAYSNYRNDGANQNADVQCIDPGNPQTTYYPAIPGLGRSWPSGYDCDLFDGEHPMGDVHPLTGTGLDTRIPFVDSKIVFTRVLADYRIADAFTLTSVTGYFGLGEQGLDNYTYDANGFGTGRTENITRAFSQELRLSSELDFFLNFTAGLYFQKQRKEFNTSQVVLGVALLPEPLGGLDADTGNGFDWTKNHGTDALAYSGFLSFSAYLMDDLELAGGARWTREEKENIVEVPYMHDAFENPALRAALPNLATEGFRTDPIEFDDQNWSPEVSLKYAVTDRVNVYGAYKTGFKSGGIDNSALLTNVSDEAIADLVFDSETAKG
ncbi:MAG: TonB-dependent receptor domain-containing protein, partial [bacterium]